VSSTRPDSNDPDVAAFLQKARRDLEVARRLAPDSDFKDVVCFHAQQAAEKALKAAMLALGLEALRTHDLDLLLASLEETDPGWKALQEMCESLADFAVAPRYPGWEETAPDIKPQDAINNATFVVRFVEKRLVRA